MPKTILGKNPKITEPFFTHVYKNGASVFYGNCLELRMPRDPSNYMLYRIRVMPKLNVEPTANASNVPRP